MRLGFFLSLLCTFSCAAATEVPNGRAITINPAAMEFARQLIKEGRISLDKKGSWTRDQPSAIRKSEFIRVHGSEEYGKWHLGIDTRRRVNSKAHYKFPFGDFRTLHRCGLLAIKARAHEYGYSEIEIAATQLLLLLDSASPGAQKRVD